MEYPRWHELNAANLTTTTAHTADFVAIRELKSREQGTGNREQGSEIQGPRVQGIGNAANEAARIFNDWGGLRW
jgi:hypothetical protein